MDKDSVAERWARLRFAVIGPLLASPPARGELQEAFRELAQQQWRHPILGMKTSLPLKSAPFGLT